MRGGYGVKYEDLILNANGKSRNNPVDCFIFSIRSFLARGKKRVL